MTLVLSGRGGPPSPVVSGRRALTSIPDPGPALLTAGRGRYVPRLVQGSSAWSRAAPKGDHLEVGLLWTADQEERPICIRLNKGWPTELQAFTSYMYWHFAPGNDSALARFPGCLINAPRSSEG